MVTKILNPRSVVILMTNKLTHNVFCNSIRRNLIFDFWKNSRNLFHGGNIFRQIL